MNALAVSSGPDGTAATFRAYCSAAARTSSLVAGGSSPRNMVMFLHIASPLEFSTHGHEDDVQSFVNRQRSNSPLTLNPDGLLGDRIEEFQLLGIDPESEFVTCSNGVSRLNPGHGDLPSVNLLLTGFVRVSRQL